MIVDSTRSVPLGYRKKIGSAIASGLNFLGSRQDIDGSFKDFSSTGFSSIEWITAHVCWVLEDLPDFALNLGRAGEFLLHRMNEDGAWGFNARASADAGTTAQVLMVLAKQKRRIDARSVAWLIGQQWPDGGFATYPFSRKTPFNNWSVPHPETTLYAVGALGRLELETDSKAQAISWLKKQQRSEPLKSFFWDNPFYILWVKKKMGFCSRTASQMSRKLLGQSALRVPSLPLLLYSRDSQFDKNILAALVKLLTEQLADGSWKCEAVLRVPRLSCGKYWTEGLLFSGDERIFSTAHAIAALFHFMKC